VFLSHKKVEAYFTWQTPIASSLETNALDSKIFFGIPLVVVLVLQKHIIFGQATNELVIQVECPPSKCASRFCQKLCFWIESVSCNYYFPTKDTSRYYIKGNMIWIYYSNLNILKPPPPPYHYLCEKIVESWILIPQFFQRPFPPVNAVRLTRTMAQILFPSEVKKRYALRTCG
jgi:hypothetical protein